MADDEATKRAALLAAEARSKVETMKDLRPVKTMWSSRGVGWHGRGCGARGELPLKGNAYLLRDAEREENLQEQLAHEPA
jgi:hypothetical protein